MRCPDINRNNRLSCNSYHPPPSHFSSSNCDDPSPGNKSAFRNAINSYEKSTKSCVRPCFVRKRNVWRKRNETRLWKKKKKKRKKKEKREVFCERAFMQSRLNEIKNTGCGKSGATSFEQSSFSRDRSARKEKREGILDTTTSVIIRQHLYKERKNETEKE